MALKFFVEAIKENNDLRIKKDWIVGNKIRTYVANASIYSKESSYDNIKNNPVRIYKDEKQHI